MSTEDDMGVRGDAIPLDLLAAVQLAVASHEMASKERAFDLIAWIVELHEVGDGRPLSVDLFTEAIKATRRPAPGLRSPGTLTSPPGAGTTLRNEPFVRPENHCEVPDAC